jgi:hypothetical protein
MKIYYRSPAQTIKTPPRDLYYDDRKLSINQLNSALCGAQLAASSQVKFRAGLMLHN